MLKSLIIASFAFVFIGTSACKSKDKGGSGPAYTLKMRLAPGDKFGQDLDMDMKMDMAGLGLGVKMNMDISMDMEAMDDTAGLKKLRFMYTKARMNMEVPGMPAASGMDTSTLNENLRKMEGMSIYIYLDKKNEIVKVEGLDELNNSVYMDDPQMKAQMDQLFSKDDLNSMMSMMFSVYPDHPVRVGDKWEKENKFKMSSITMTLKNKYKLKEVTNGTAIIEVVADYGGKGKMAEGGMEVEVDMDGEQKGTIGVSVDNGYMRSADYKMDLKAKAKIMGQSVPIDMKANYVMKGH